MIKWLGENGGELVGTNKYLCVQKKDLCVQIRFICRLHRNALVEAQECYECSRHCFVHSTLIYTM
jgi:hypothetical protein